MALKFAAMAGLGVFFSEPVPLQLQMLPSLGLGGGVGLGRGYPSGPRDPAEKLHHRAKATFLCQPSVARVTNCGCGNWLLEGTARSRGTGTRAGRKARGR